MCELPKKKFVCTNCCNQIATSRRQDITILCEERDAYKKCLEEALDAKEAKQRSDVQLLHVQERMTRSRMEVVEIEKRLSAIRQRTAELQKQNQERRGWLREASTQMGRLAHRTHKDLGAQMEALGHSYLRSLDTLLREHRNRVVRRLQDILPMKLLTPRPSAAQGRGSEHAAPAVGAVDAERALVMICGLLLPDSRGDIGEMVQLLPHLGSSLGYVALLLDVMSRFLQLPVLHRTAFQGSTTYIWQPESFWDMRSHPPPHALPLFPPGHKAHQEGGLHDLGGALYSAVAGMAGGGSAPEADAQQAQRAQQALQRGLYLLQQSAGVMVWARLGPDAPLKLPPDWSPLAWLGGLCRVLGGEPRVGAGRGVQGHPHPHPLHQQGSHYGRVAAGGAGGGLAASVVFGRLSPQQDALSQSMSWPEDDGGEEEWDIIPRPSYGRMIPPPPSNPDDVEHWAQAMYPAAPADGQAAQQVPAQQGVFVLPGVAGSPVDRIRSYLSTYLGRASGGREG